MATGELSSLIETLCEAAVLADLEDLQSLGKLHRSFTQLADAALNSSSLLHDGAQRSAKLVEAVILHEDADPATTLAVLANVASVMQAHVRDGAPLSFPKELGSFGSDAHAPQPEAAPQAHVGSESSTPFARDVALLRDFIVESREHLDAADNHLMTIEANPGDLESVNAVFRAFHTIKGLAGFLDLKEIGAVAHESEYLLDQAREGKVALVGCAIDVTFDAVTTLRRLIDAWDQFLADGVEPAADDGLSRLIARIKSAISGDVQPIGAILVETAHVSEATIALAVDQQRQTPGKKIGEILVDTGEVAPKDVAHALRLQSASVTAAQNASTQAVVKVDSDRLERLVDAVGELVIAVSMAKQATMETDSVAAVGRRLGQLEKITREVQELGTSLRMVSIKPVFQKMARLARDVAKKAGKQIEFAMEGEDTELDKSVVDHIADPLVHMIRNSVDHGIEADASARVAAGKPAAGQIRLTAVHKGGNIFIEIKDDGRGLDRDAILRKGRERGLVAEDANPSEREIFNLIFEPGFSTAKTVTDVSGRGVGMDVVRRNIEKLRGSINIQSEVGKGAMISISLPLTLAIIDGMVVRVGDQRYVAPTLSIITSLRPTERQINQVMGKGETLRFQDQLIPLVRLHQMFAIATARTNPLESIVIVAETDGKKLGIMVDELVGQQQVVIKPLVGSLRSIPGLAGGAIMPDGLVGLILDVGGLSRLKTEHRLAS